MATIYYSNQSAKDLKAFDRIICPICEADFTKPQVFLKHYIQHRARGEQRILTIKERLIKWYKKNTSSKRL